MAYLAPELTLIDQATGLVLGPGLQIDPDNNCSGSSRTEVFDCANPLESEW